MSYDGPGVFLAPVANDAAQENLQRTVLDGVDASVVARHTDREPDGDVVRLWGTKQTVNSWKNVEPGDFLLFYADGVYEYGAVTIDTEENESLGREVWPNHEEDQPWSQIIYLKEPTRVDVDSAVIHGLAGYDREFPLGFSPLNEMGIGGIRGRYGSVEELVYGDGSSVDGEGSSVDVSATLQADIPESVLGDLHFPNGEATELVNQVESALNAGKHVVFTGPPGTGKTEIARRISRHLVDEHPDVFTGYQMTTATADWSTFETVGGYMPEEHGDGDLGFEPGQVLRRFKKAGAQRNELLVIDEINRADIDKSFGQLFTLLSGQRVQLPFKRDGEEIEIVPAEESDGDLPPHRYVKPASWRIMATMNSYDKTSLYELSYAFMRRFAFIHVDAPDVPEDSDAQVTLVREYADTWGFSSSDEVLSGVGEVWHVANTTVENRKLGPAIVRDLINHVENSPADVETALTQAVGNYVFPQLEGVRGRKKIVGELATVDALNEERLVALARDVLGVDPRSEV